MDRNETAGTGKAYTANHLSFEDVRERGLEKRKSLIMEATLKLIHQKLQEITLQDIAEKARISSASVYKYFPRRTDLFNEALSHIAETRTMAGKE